MKSTIDTREVAKFNALSHYWWDQDGPLKTLHDINPARIQFIEKYANLKNVRILDVGCGGGILTEALALRGAELTGLDADEEAIITAATHAKGQGLEINYLQAAIEDFESLPFDVITCMEMLEHVQNPGVVIEHCQRLLKPQGKLFLSTINRNLKAYGGAILMAEYILGLLPRQTHDYEKFIKPSELAALVRGANLTVESLAGIRYNPFSRQSTLSQSVDINYLMYCQKKA